MLDEIIDATSQKPILMWFKTASGEYKFCGPDGVLRETGIVHGLVWRLNVRPEWFVGSRGFRELDDSDDLHNVRFFGADLVLYMAGGGHSTILVKEVDRLPEHLIRLLS